MITVSFACNDPDNGLPLGRACSIQIGDSEFEHPDGGLLGDGCILRCGDRSFKISRRTFPCNGWISWYGNWCWDATRMSEKDAVELVSYVRQLGWKMTGGLVDLGDLYDSGNDITPEVLREAASWP